MKKNGNLVNLVTAYNSRRPNAEFMNKYLGLDKNQIQATLKIKKCALKERICSLWVWQHNFKNGNQTLKSKSLRIIKKEKKLIEKLSNEIHAIESCEVCNKNEVMPHEFFCKNCLSSTEKSMEFYGVIA